MNIKAGDIAESRMGNESRMIRAGEKASLTETEVQRIAFTLLHTLARQIGEVDRVPVTDPVSLPLSVQIDQ
jgi:hypothetical protein